VGDFLTTLALYIPLLPPETAMAHRISQVVALYTQYSIDCLWDIFCPLGPLTYLCSYFQRMQWPMPFTQVILLQMEIFWPLWLVTCLPRTLWPMAFFLWFIDFICWLFCSLHTLLLASRDNYAQWHFKCDLLATWGTFTVVPIWLFPSPTNCFYIVNPIGLALAQGFFEIRCAFIY
jgi:hypothetical protein